VPLAAAGTYDRKAMGTPMASVEKMWTFFDIVDDLINRISQDDDHKRQLLDSFFFRVLTVCDGLEGPEGWKGIALVATEDLPDEVEEINDGFLHDMWSDRPKTREWIELE
jgi:hypothetical protein